MVNGSFKGVDNMSTMGMVTFWLSYGAIITLINIIYLRRVNKELDMECERAERYKERYEKLREYMR